MESHLSNGQWTRIPSEQRTILFQPSTQFVENDQRFLCTSPGVGSGTAWKNKITQSISRRRDVSPVVSFGSSSREILDEWLFGILPVSISTANSVSLIFFLISFPEIGSRVLDSPYLTSSMIRSLFRKIFPLDAWRETTEFGWSTNDISMWSSFDSDRIGSSLWRVKSVEGFFVRPPWEWIVNGLTEFCWTTLARCWTDSLTHPQFDISPLKRV